ncbi:glutaredoxin family protein [Macrococcoides caseolyticum]|uniref:NrdH-redoxin n=1 Tax=Macrococcoides caseolyticum TaxID=69966 RepID=A0A855GSC4_9STAP|nr:glutaredoxin family protein [Macrococcus caseolyticus]PKE25685.1 NrdH-redoxin [Macrococcus caseolyticus]PKE50799.1 NrdH-redoxin [Macrococcus caseolyticus]PKE58199.1 NrdH-redoxin [Macrococcus caseolyticus]PKE69256.1 NrdH-redoxin [Macrococcus caseolyticus]PKF21955.1 NrdH-redoxin [Macrococcus caseolyticus]
MNIEIYTQDDCPPCTFIKQYFTNKGYAFTEKNIAHMSYKIEMIDYDAMSTPLIKIDDALFYQPDIDKIEAYLHA